MATKPTVNTVQDDRLAALEEIVAAQGQAIAALREHNHKMANMIMGLQMQGEARRERRIGRIDDLDPVV